MNLGGMAKDGAHSTRNANPSHDIYLGVLACAAQRSFWAAAQRAASRRGST